MKVYYTVEFRGSSSAGDPKIADSIVVIADSRGDAVEQARDELDQVARGLERADGFKPGDCVYAIIHSDGADPDMVYLILTTDHVRS